MRSNVIECKFLPFDLKEAPYLTVAKVQQEDIAYYLQSEIDFVKWIPFEQLLVKVFEPEFYDSKFITDILKKYKDA
jgi:hypothetical protein